MDQRWRLGGEEHFRWRGAAVSRLEALTDAVFAIALTLLIMSLEVPRTYGDLRAAFAQLPVFAVCFSVLIWLWYCHYKFHRRYGLEDLWTIVLNCALLFLILFYAFPLKFLFGWLYAKVAGLGTQVVGADGSPAAVLADRDIPELMMLYSGGFAGIFVLFALLHGNALRLRGPLGLTDTELVMTRCDRGAHLLSAALGATSFAIAAFLPRLSALAGMLYFLMGPLHGWYGWRCARAIERAAATEKSA